LSYLIVEPFYSSRNISKRDLKLIAIALGIIVLLFSGYYGMNYYKSIKSESYSYVPYYYTLQWQKAMSWVRENTPQNAVFAHWWDYGYWLQSIGERATVTDGGNVIVWWNYLMGRNVLTGDDQKSSLEFLWNHNATHLLIDSSDIGKYGAFSQIGSNEEYDRFSTGPITLISNNQQIQETASGMIRVYQTNSIVDEDISYILNGTRVFLPGITLDSSGDAQFNAGVIGAVVETKEIDGRENYVQPTVVYYYQGRQIKLPIRYIYYKDHLYDFKAGVEAALYIIQEVNVENNQLSVDQSGAAIYLSPRILKGFLGQVYLLDNSLGNFNNFKLVHNQPDYIIENINQQSASQGIELDDFVYYQGLRGPIKIWEIEYSGSEKKVEDYLLRSPPDYITWKF
jgi:hypothetical protein